MDFTKLIEAINTGNKTSIEDYLRYEILVPCMKGHDNCSWEHHVPEGALVDDDFMRPYLVDMSSYSINQPSEMVYDIHIRGHYIDTFAVEAEEHEFAKFNVGLKLDGTMDMNSSVFEGEIFLSTSAML